MNWRWLTFDYADPDLPLTRRQRWHIAFRAPPRHRSRRSGLLYAALVAALYVAFFALMPWIWEFSRFLPSWWWRFALTCVAFGLGLHIWQALLTKLMFADVHRAAIRQLGYDICMKCGYWLRGLSDDVKQCPECGAARESMRNDGDGQS